MRGQHMDNKPYSTVWSVVKINDDVLLGVYGWCAKEIGVGHYDFSIGWADGTRDFYFKHEEDKVKFILRWL